MRRLSILVCASWLFSSGAGYAGQTLHGPNVNPANMAVLFAWEDVVGTQAGMIGDNLWAATWEDFEKAGSFAGGGTAEGLIAIQLARWVDAFDGDGVVEADFTFPRVEGNPKGELSSYMTEFAIQMFPERMEDVDGNLVEARFVADRWDMWQPDNRHYPAARNAFQKLAEGLVAAGLEKAHLRLAWEFTGYWYPWGLAPSTSPQPGDPEDFKQCWKFIFETMEAVSPDFEWGWCAHIGYDDFDPVVAFPEFTDGGTTTVLVDYISVHIYDVDGMSYYRNDNPNDPNFQLTPDYWNERPDEQRAAFGSFYERMMEGDGDLPVPGNATRNVGLRYFKELADAKGLRFSFSEWGLWANYVLAAGSDPAVYLRSNGFSGDDNPFFINGLFDWMEANDVYSAAQFEFYLGEGFYLVDHSLLPDFWGEPVRDRPLHVVYPDDPEYSGTDDQTHPKAAAAFYARLRAIAEDPIEYEAIGEGAGQFELLEASLPASLRAGRAFDYTVSLRNTGAPTYDDGRSAVLCVLSGEDVVQRIPIASDLRNWTPEAGTIVLAGTGVASTDVHSGSLGFALWIPSGDGTLQSNPAFSLRFANVDVWEPARGFNFLKRAAVDRASTYFSTAARETELLSLAPEGAPSGVRLDAEGQAGQTVDVLRSFDLDSWETLGTPSFDAGGKLEYLHFPSVGEERGFYRLRSED